MALTAGTRLGPYEIATQIDVGGMGELYRATDTKLKRQMAIDTHSQDPPQELDPALPVDPRCVTCFDAGGFRIYVAGLKTTFEAMLREAEGRGGR